MKLSATTCVNLMHRAEDHEFRLVIPFILCTGHSFLKFRAGFSNLLSRTYDSRHYAQGRHYAYDTGSCRFFSIWCLWRGAAHGTLRCRQLVCPTGLSASSFCSTWRARSCAFACTFGAVWKESVYSSILLMLLTFSSTLSLRAAVVCLYYVQRSFVSVLSAVEAVRYLVLFLSQYTRGVV